MNSVTTGLLESGCEVRVLTICSDKHPLQQEHLTEEYRQQTRIEAIHIDLSIHPIGAAVALLCGESYHVKRFESKAFAERIAEILKDEEYDIVHLESLYLTPYVPVIRQHSQARIVLRAHNVEHLIWQRMAQSEKNLLKRWYLKKLALALRMYECEHLNDYDGIVSITEKDADFFRQAGCRKPVVPVPFGIAPEPVEHVDEEPGSLFHIGSMDWMPNVEGVNWFLDEVWPTVHRQLPQVRLYLVGRKMPEEMMQREIAGVTIVGEVPDAMYFIGSKQINIVPLLSGSGIRVKIIEAMSAGKTVISTHVGAEGIHYTEGENILIADTAEEFAAQIRHCMEDADDCRRIGENAYSLILQEYSIEHTTEKILNFYNTLLP